jgi:hypothetical protein
MQQPALALWLQSKALYRRQQRGLLLLLLPVVVLVVQAPPVQVQTRTERNYGDRRAIKSLRGAPQRQQQQQQQVLRQGSMMMTMKIMPPMNQTEVLQALGLKILATTMTTM